MVRNWIQTLMFALPLTIASAAGATSMTYSLDAHFSSGGLGVILDQGSFTADDVTGSISAFSWDAIAATGFTALDETNILSGFATFSGGALTGLSIIASDGTTTLLLGLDSGTGGLLAEQTTAGVAATGTYVIRDSSGGSALGDPVPQMPEPTGVVLFGAGLLIVGRTMRQRRRR
jgi:hypothetical protein